MARKQSSTIYYQGNKHKEIYYQGHYHDKMYKGSQLVWEKLEELSKYKWEVVPIKNSSNLAKPIWTSFSDNVYVAAHFSKTKRDGSSGSVIGYYIGKWIPTTRKLKLIKKFSSTYERLDSMYATEYGIITDYYQPDTGNEILSVIKYNIDNNSEMKKIENGDIGKETTVYRRLNNEICILCSDGIWQISHAGLNTVGYPELIKRDFEENIIESDTFKTGFKAISANVILLSGKYVTIGCTTHTVKNKNGYEIEEYKLSINGEYTFDDWMRYYYADMKTSCIVNNVIYWVMNYRYSTDAGKINYEDSNYYIYSCDGSKIKKLKDLGKDHFSKICYIAGIFFCFAQAYENKKMEYFWVGKTIETMTKVEYKNSKSYVYNVFDCPVADDEYIYVPFEERQFYMDTYEAAIPGEKALKINKFTFEIIEEIEIDIINEFEK